MMTENEFRELLVNTVKACGEELIDRAEDLVGEGSHICSFNISINFPIDGPRLDGCPTFEITREHYSPKVIDVIVESIK